MNMLIHSISTVLLTTLLAASPPALAGPGHDHGEENVASAGAASPRFAATSELFELVGILDGRRLALYLDRTEDNSPVKGATLELEIGGSKLVVKEVADGEFETELPEVPGAGVLPVTAVVVAGTESDLLAGELDIHESGESTEAHPQTAWARYVPWAAGIAFAGGLLAAVVAALRARSIRAGRAA